MAGALSLYDFTWSELADGRGSAWEFLHHFIVFTSLEDRVPSTS